MNTFFFAAEFLKYLFKAKGRHGLHSSFIYELYEKVICESHQYYDFSPIEYIRKRLLGSTQSIEVVDFGAGNNNSKTRKVRDIAQVSSISPKSGKMLFRLVNFMQPKVMVEMGTSLGISTLYQAKASPDACFITMEGSPQTAAIAVKNIEALKAANVKVVVGDFKSTLPKVLNDLQKVDYVLFDGNHRKEATLEYFRSFLPKVSDDCVFVFDDIRWSKGMMEAWEQIIKEQSATVTVDLFSMGIVFFRKGQVKQHFTLRF